MADLLRNLDVNKALGPDGIPARVLKECANELAPSLCYLFNKSLSLSVVPSQWKLAHVVPIHKKGSKEHVSNYRPVSLLCILSKVLERCVFNRLYKHLAPVLQDAQHGFIRGRSTVTELLTFLHDIGAALDKSLETDVVYLDLPKAFDSVDHGKLVLKLKQHGVEGNLLSWLANYLSDRKQRTVVSGALSKPLPVISGVPQGSLLGPLLFVVYTNDIQATAASSCSILIFADDTKCYKTIETQDDSRKLQEGLDLLYRWSIRWRLNLNIKKKCDCVNITRKKYPANHVYSLGGKNLRKTDSQQDLGLLTSSNAKFSKHGSKVINKANSMLGLLKRNCSSKHFSVRARRLLYLALVKTHLDYASEAWSGQSLNITSAIERVQRRATNYILGIPSRSVPYKERLSRTNLLPLTYWHEIKDILFIHGCLNGKYNINIERFVKFAPETNHRSWCHNNFVIPRSRTKHFQQSFFIRSCRLWNSLPKELKLVNSTTNFKKQLKCRYEAASGTVFDVDIMRTWRSICFKCGQLQDLTSSNFRVCC